MGTYLNYFMGSPDGLRGLAQQSAGAWWRAWAEAFRAIDQALPEVEDPEWRGSAVLNGLASIDWCRRVTLETELSYLAHGADLWFAQHLEEAGAAAWVVDEPEVALRVDRFTALFAYNITQLRHHSGAGRAPHLYTQMLARGLRAPAELGPPWESRPQPCVCEVKWHRYPRSDALIGATPQARALWSYLFSGRTSVLNESHRFTLTPDKIDEEVVSWFSLAECERLHAELPDPAQLPERDGERWPRVALQYFRQALDDALEARTGLFALPR